MLRGELTKGMELHASSPLKRSGWDTGCAMHCTMCVCTICVFTQMRSLSVIRKRG